MATPGRKSEAIHMATMRAIQVRKPNGPLELVQREIPKPGAGQVRIKVAACGICHSDSFVVLGSFPGIEYPRTPGHEIAGVVDAVGDGPIQWRPGQRVGVGWHGGHCGQCKSCRRGDFVTCQFLQVPGMHYDGGYAEYVVVPVSALATIPEELSAEYAAPLMCAGITTYNGLRHSGARPGDLVAILGIGGLGHLGVQFAAKMGFRTVAIGRGADKEGFARKLGADRYIDSAAQDVGAELTKLGGARVILATAPSNRSMSAAMGGLGIDGKLVIVGASTEPLELNTMPMILARQAVQAWPSGTSLDSEETMAFSALTGVRPIIETMPLERAAAAYERMMSGQARFRMVLAMQH